MKKYVISLLILLFAVLASAQQENQKTGALCDVQVVNTLKMHVYFARIYYNDAGDEVFHFIREDEHKKKIFPSVVSVIDYMTRDNWQLVTYYRNYGELHFVFRRG